jgi:hypothetical protein
MRNGSRFASFRFEAKKYLKRNRRTLVVTSSRPPRVQVKNKLIRAHLHLYICLYIHTPIPILIHISIPIPIYICIPIEIIRN